MGLFPSLQFSRFVPDKILSDDQKRELRDWGSSGLSIGGAPTRFCIPVVLSLCHFSDFSSVLSGDRYRSPEQRNFFVEFKDLEDGKGSDVQNGRLPSKSSAEKTTQRTVEASIGRFLSWTCRRLQCF